VSVAGQQLLITLAGSFLFLSLIEHENELVTVNITNQYTLTKSFAGDDFGLKEKSYKEQQGIMCSKHLRN